MASMSFGQVSAIFHCPFWSIWYISCYPPILSFDALLWIYDFRTNEHFTLKTNPLKREDLNDFVSRYNAENRHKRKETERFKSFAYEDLLKRNKVSLDIFWLKDESLEDSANLPDPDVIAAEIAEDLQAALDQFTQIAADLRK
jgi:type I restriction enzyme M protein